MNKLRKNLDLVLSNMLMVLMGLMLLQVIWQVFSRYLIGVPSSFTDELSRFLLIWIGVLGAGYVSGKNMHLSIDLLSTRLGPEGKMRLRILIGFLIILFAITVLVIGGIRLVYVTLMLGQTSSSLTIPLGYVYVVLPVTGIVIILYGVFDIYELLTKTGS